MKFSLAQSGLQQSPLNFIDLIPAQMYKEYINDILKRYDELGTTEAYDVFPAAFQFANYNNKDILPEGNRFSELEFSKRYIRDPETNEITNRFNVIQRVHQGGNLLTFIVENLRGMHHQDFSDNHQYSFYNMTPNSKLYKAIVEVFERSPYRYEETLNIKGVVEAAEINDDLLTKSDPTRDLVKEALDEDTTPTSQAEEAREAINEGEEREKQCR